jgi:hypothetical protein
MEYSKSFPGSLTLYDEEKEVQDIVVTSLLVIEDRIRGDFRLEGQENNKKS